MWTILVFIVAQGTWSGSSAQVSLSTQQVGKYADIKTCQAIANQISGFKELEGFAANTWIVTTARCVQISDPEPVKAKSVK